MPASGGQKPQFWANFDFLGASVPTPFTDDGQIWYPIADHGICLLAKFRLDQFILSPSLGEKPQFLPFFWTSAFSSVAN